MVGANIVDRLAVVRRACILLLVALAMAGCGTTRPRSAEATTTTAAHSRSSLLSASSASSSSAPTAALSPEAEPVFVAPTATTPTTAPPRTAPPTTMPRTTAPPSPTTTVPRADPCTVATAYIAAHGAPGWTTVCGYHAGYDVAGCVAAAQSLGGRLPYGCTDPTTQTSYIACPIFVVYANEAENQRYASGLGGRLDAYGEAPQCAYDNPLGN